MKIYLTILLAMLFVFACDSSDPSSNETKCTSDTDCTDSARPVCNTDGKCVEAGTNLFINEIMASNDSYLDGSDWVEIYNPNDTDIDLAGFYLCDNHYSDDGIDSCTKIPDTDAVKTTVKAKGFLVFTFNKDLTGILNITQNLGSSGDSVYLISASEDVVDSYVYDDTSGLDTDISIGRSTDGGDTWELFSTSLEKAPTPNAANGSILSSAVCTATDTTACTGETTLCLVDDTNELNNKCVACLADTDCIDMICNDENVCEAVAVAECKADDVSECDAATPLCLVDNTNELNNKCVECLLGTDCESGTCNIDNTCEPTVPQALFINEIMAKNSFYTEFTDSDWVEIYNNSDTDIDLAGYYLCDDNYANDGITECTQVPDTDAVKTTVASKSFIVFFFNKDDIGGVLNVAQKLGTNGDTVTLIAPDETVVDSKEYLDTDALGENISLGRSVDGGDVWELFTKDGAKEPTPGATNVQ